MPDLSLTPLAQAYLQRRADLVRVFTARMRSQTRAEDLVQAMFEKVMAVPVQDQIGNPVAYLYRLGANLMLDDIRQAQRQRVRETAWSDLQGDRHGGERASDAPGPQRSVEARQRLAQLMATVETLPPQTRRVFRLHKLQGLSHQRTAESLGISKSAVEKHVSLALKLLTDRSS